MADDEHEAALAALLNDANARSEKLEREQNKSRPQWPHRDSRGNAQDRDGRGKNDNNWHRHNHDKRPMDDRDGRVKRPDHNREERGHDYRQFPREGGYKNKPIVEDERDGQRRKRRRWNDGEEEGGEERWGRKAGEADKVNEPEEPVDKVKADFGLSGALATDSNTGNVCNGVTLKFSEPPEARIPNTRWRLYVFRKKSPNATDPKGNEPEDDLIDTYHISKQSAYLFGRERKVADIPVDHPSLSKQHAVLQYRSLPAKNQEIGAPPKLQCKPYLMDLESTNGTFINGVRIDSARYYELRRGDVITLGASTREYVLLTEQSAKTGI